MIGNVWKFITGNDRIHVTFCVTGEEHCTYKHSSV